MMGGAEAIARLLLKDLAFYDKLINRKKPTSNTTVHREMRKQLKKSPALPGDDYPLDHELAAEVAYHMDRIRKEILNDVEHGGPEGL